MSWIRLFWAWLRDGKCQWQLADETLLKLPPAFAAIPPEEETITQKPPINMANIPSLKHHNHQSIITTDCKSLFDLISRHAPPSCQEFRTQLQAKLIKEHLNNGIMIRWSPVKHNWRMPSRKLWTLVSCGNAWPLGDTVSTMNPRYSVLALIPERNCSG